MIIEFHFAGENRKKLAWVVAMIIGTTAEYGSSGISVG